MKNLILISISIVLFTAGCATAPVVVHVPQTNGVTIGYEPNEYPGFVLVPKTKWVEILKKMEEDLQQ